MRLFILILLFASCQIVYGNYEFSDTSFVKSFFGGSSFTIPAGKRWTIEKAYISSNDGYNILINKNTFSGPFKSGEKLSIPYYIPEMELLSKKDMVSYLLYIKEEKE